MKKLTFDEIIQILKDNQISVYDFAYNDFTIPTDFVYSEELQNRIDLFEVNYSAYQKHPDFDLFRYKREEASQEFRDVYQTHADSPKPYADMENEFLTSLGFGPIVEVEKYGGEGQGETWYSTKHFTSHDVYITTNGYYTSYDGVTFDDDDYGDEVIPVERLITVYEIKK